MIDYRWQMIYDIWHMTYDIWHLTWYDMIYVYVFQIQRVSLSWGWFRNSDQFNFRLPVFALIHICFWDWQFLWMTCHGERLRLTLLHSSRDHMHCLARAGFLFRHLGTQSSFFALFQNTCEVRGTQSLFLVLFRNDCEVRGTLSLFLVRFRNNCEVRVHFPISPELALFWRCLAVFWRCSGGVLAVFWQCSGSVPAVF